MTIAPAVAAVAVLAVGGVGFGHAIARGQAPRSGTGAVDPSIVAVRGLTSPAGPPSVPAVTGTSVTRPPDAPSPPSTGPTAPPVVPPTPTPKVTHQPAHHKVVRHPAPPAAALRIIDIGPSCYVQVSTGHGHVLVRRILHGGQQLVFRRHGLTIVLGNAGGVRISVDGHQARIAGKAGQVRKIRER